MGGPRRRVLRYLDARHGGRLVQEAGRSGGAELLIRWRQMAAGPAVLERENPRTVFEELDEIDERAAAVGVEGVAEQHKLEAMLREQGDRIAQVAGHADREERLKEQAAGAVQHGIVADAEEFGLRAQGLFPLQGN